MIVYGTPQGKSWCEPLLYFDAGRRGGKTERARALAEWQRNVIGDNWWWRDSEVSCADRSPYAFT